MVWQVFFCKLETMRQSIIYQLSYHLGLHRLFPHSNEKDPELIHWLKINSKDLQIDLPLIFIMRALILAWPFVLFVSKFCIMFSISLLETFRVSKHFSVIQWRLRGASLLSVIKKSCFAKNELKSSTIF